MYPENVKKIFAKSNINIGDRISIESRGRIHEGILMPKTDLGNANSITIKLDSGYNIGLLWKNSKIRKLASHKDKSPKEKKPESKIKIDFRKPHISLITTGGTITSKVDYKTGGVTSLMTAKELLSSVPELNDFSSIDILHPINVMGESMSPRHWQQLATIIAKQLKKSEGVILTHGTDTLHFTASALSFMLKDLSKPVVITGAQRSSDRGSSDSAFNIICSARAALSDIASVGICMHANRGDDYSIFTKGTKVRKMHTSRRDAFRPINDVPLAKVWPDGKIEKMQDSPKRSKKVTVADTRFEEKVALLKLYPGASPKILDFYTREGYRGIVLELLGLGQAPTYGPLSFMKSIKKATENGVLVCGAAETLYGRLNANVYKEGRLTREAGVLHLEDMLPETAYVKLGWVLGHTKSLEKAREMMLENIAGEITKRSLPGTFLY